MTIKQVPRSRLSHCIAALSVSALPAVAGAQMLPGGQALLEEVVVVGIRGSQEAAVDVKRNSVNIVDSIVAEDIGKLPDVTIADSLQRVTGVQIQREAGEGTSLNVRGMPQVLTTLNGEQFLSPWSITDVQANYTDIPAGMVSSVDVIKSQSASTLSGGISGVIDLKTRRPLAMPEGWTTSVGLETSEGSMTEDPNHNVNAFVGFNTGSVGFTLAAFNTLTNSANYRMDETTRLAFTTSGGDPLDINGNGDLNDRYLVPGAFGVKSYVMERERDGVATSFQMDMGDAFTLTADLFYNKMDQIDRGVEGRFLYINDNSYDQLREGSLTTPVTVLPATGDLPERTLNTVQFAQVEAPDFQATSASYQNHTEALNGSIKLFFEPGTAFSGSVQYNGGEAERLYEQVSLQQATPHWDTIDRESDGVLDRRGPFNISVDYRPEYPVFTLDDDMSHPDHLSQFQAFADGFDQEATLNTFRADGRYDLDNEGLNSIEFGVRFSSRDVETANFIYMTPTARNPSGELLEGDYVWQRYPDWTSFFGNPDQGVPQFEALQAELIAYNDFGPFKGWENGVGAVDPESMDDVAGFMNLIYDGTQRFNQPSRQYAVTEDETSAYAQYNFTNDTGLFGVPFDGNIGVRVVNTEREVVTAVTDVSAVPEAGNYYGGNYEATLGRPQGYQVVYKLLDTQTHEASFDHVLPMANINFYPNEEVIVRLSYNETMARNDLTNVGETEALWFQEYKVYSETGSEQDDNGRFDRLWGVGGGDDYGTPDLEPWQASNYNLSTEWYFNEGGLLSAAAFLIKVDTATQTVQENREYPDEDGVVRRSVNVWVSENLAASDLKGIELGYRQAMTFLPGFLSDTGVEFNYTYSDSDSGDKDLLGESFPLPSNSEHQTNLVLWYQGEKLSSRLAYNWRSDIYQGQVGVLTSEVALDMGNWTESAGYLDASMNYDINDSFTVYLQGTNLTETSNRNYAQFDSQFQSVAAQERRLAAGVRVRF
ncbi:TonB-dependent receptor [Marinimicrobium agarilyticum]|uniref:TonB-dependent receptor n=1 Tax=Marinimicrobium agarilyticum TaxID=306546 RepID=UPI000402FBA1|nr:TonB-dependent receptor [Marinimicrobium agarilyticum]